MLTDSDLTYLSSERLHIAGDRNRCRNPEPSIRQSLKNLVEELERLKDREGIGTYSTRRPTASTNLYPWELLATNPSTKEHTKAGPWHLHTYVANV